MSIFNPQANADAFDRNNALYPSAYSASSCAIMDRTSMLDAQTQTIREQVDQRIAELESEIRALKTHRNSVADTSRLPPEILSKIFITVRGIVANDYCLRKSSWLRVTCVCRHWRAVAMDCSPLWADLMFGNPAFTEVMLQRSKNAPLTVKFAGKALPFNDILCKIASQTSRLHVVELESGPYAMLEFPKILSNFDRAAPILEQLVLHGADFPSWAEGDEHHIIPPSFLQDGAPSLRHLDITRFTLHWNALPLSTTLTHLRLKHVGPENRPSRTSFLKTLAKLGQLETLKLSAYLPHSNDTSRPDSLPITLPSLRILELQDPAAEMRQFFSAIQIPKEARVDIELSDGPPESESSFGSLFFALREAWTLSKNTEVDAAGSSAQPNVLDLRVVDSSPRDKPGIMCWFNDHDRPSNFDVELSPPANLVASAPSAYTLGINLLLKVIARCLDISSLRSLQIASDYAVPSKGTLALFKDLTKLDRIAIGKSHEALSNFLRNLKKKKDRALSFPSLRSLELHDIDFDEDLLGESNSAVRALGAALKSRKKYRPAIEQFRMTECTNFREKHWEFLRKALSGELEMHWDEIEKIVEPSDSDWDGDDTDE